MLQLLHSVIPFLLHILYLSPHSFSCSLCVLSHSLCRAHVGSPVCGSLLTVARLGLYNSWLWLCRPLMTFVCCSYVIPVFTVAVMDTMIIYTELIILSIPLTLTDTLHLTFYAFGRCTLLLFYPDSVFSSSLILSDNKLNLICSSQWRLPKAFYVESCGWLLSYLYAAFTSFCKA